jgi:GPH family glycoside/pentoside/hexuronide:cation symporter
MGKQRPNPAPPFVTKLSIKDKIGYSLGDAACHIVFDNVMFYMMFFYTDIFGIPAAFVGTLFLVSRVADAISDPVMGLVADRTRTRWGKFRPYILWGAIPFGVICTLTYLTPDLGMTGKLIYASVTYFLLTLIFTAVNIPYCALGDVITPDPKQRMSLQSWRFVLSGLSGMLSTVLLLPLATWLGGENKALGYGAGMAVLSVVAVVMLFLCYFWTKERVQGEAQFSAHIRDDIKCLWKNGPWRTIGVLSLLNIMQWSVRGGAMIYYTTYFVGNAALFTVFLGTYSAGSVVGVALAKPFTSRFCKIKVFSWLNGLLALTSFVMFFIPAKAVTVMFAFCFLIGLMHQMMTPIQWVMISDAVDFGEWQDRRRLSGISFAGMIFVMKLGLAISGALIGWTLSAVGYVAGASTQTPLSMSGILVMFTIIPALLYLASVFVTKFYKLKGPYFEEITTALEQQRVPSAAI